MNKSSLLATAATFMFTPLAVHAQGASGPQSVSEVQKPTFSAYTSVIVPPAGATDILTLVNTGGVATRILSADCMGTNPTAAANVQFDLVRRSTVDSGGSLVAVTSVPFDAGTTATATVNRYVTNAGTLGTAVGTVMSRMANIGETGTTYVAAAPATFNLTSAANPAAWGERPTLTKKTDMIAINLAGQTLAATTTLTCGFTWTEK